MSLRYGLTIDPGMENGVCLFSWSEANPIQIEHRWQFPGGVQGLRNFMNIKRMRIEGAGSRSPELRFEGLVLDVLVVEKFTPRPHESFSLTLKSVEPLRGEGAIIDRGFDDWIDWQEPAEQYFMGAPALPLEVKKKLARDFLKNYNMLPTGKEFHRPNADDAISATLHTIAWMRHKRHMPTLRAYFPDTREETE